MRERPKEFFRILSFVFNTPSSNMHGEVKQLKFQFRLRSLYVPTK